MGFNSGFKGLNTGLLQYAASLSLFTNSII